MTAIVILEDEAAARHHLEAALRRVAPEAEVACALPSLAAAMEWFRGHPPPDLLLADIQLADGLSFELFERAPVTCPVVFCTAHDEYALRALSAGGIDYLLKPIDDADLTRALRRYRRLAGHFAERVHAAPRRLTEPRRLLARRRDGFVPLPVECAAYFAVQDEQVTVVTRDGLRFELDQTLAELEASLDPARFFRVNRQYLVAATAIDGFRPHLKGKLEVSISPAPAGPVIVSQENAARFRTWLRG